MTTSIVLLSRSPETFLYPHMYRLFPLIWTIVLSLQFASFIPGTFCRESDKHRLHMGSEIDKYGQVDMLIDGDGRRAV
jgi:hypothetical protein